MASELIIKKSDINFGAVEKNSIQIKPLQLYIGNRSSNYISSRSRLLSSLNGLENPFYFDDSDFPLYVIGSYNFSGLVEGDIIYISKGALTINPSEFVAGVVNSSNEIEFSIMDLKSITLENIDDFTAGDTIRINFNNSDAVFLVDISYKYEDDFYWVNIERDIDPSIGYYEWDTSGIESGTIEISVSDSHWEFITQSQSGIAVFSN